MTPPPTTRRGGLYPAGGAEAEYALDVLIAAAEDLRTLCYKARSDAARAGAFASAEGAAGHERDREWD